MLRKQLKCMIILEKLEFLFSVRGSWVLDTNSINVAEFVGVVRGLSWIKDHLQMYLQMPDRPLPIYALLCHNKYRVFYNKN